MSARELPLTPFGEWLDAQEVDNLHDLARSLGCPTNHPFQWMVGSRKPTPKQIRGLAERFQVDPDELYHLLGKIPPDIEQGLKHATPDVFKAVRMYL